MESRRLRMQKEQPRAAVLHNEYSAFSINYSWQIG